MKCIFLFWTVFFHCAFAQSQTWEELNKQCDELNKAGQFAQAIPIAEKALSEALKDPLGKDNPNYLISLYNLGVLLTRVSRYNEAEPLFIEVRTKIKLFLNEESIDYAVVGEGLAELYLKTDEYEKARLIIIHSKNIIEKTLGKDHPLYASFLTQLARVYLGTGEYGLAEPLYIEAKNIRKKSPGETSSEYAVSLLNLGIFYKIVNQYDKAELLFIQGEEIFRKVLGENHPDYASCLNSLASLYMDKGDYIKAEEYLIAAKEIWGKVLGENHPDYAINLNNLAELYRILKQYEKAEPLYLKSIEIKKQILGENNTSFATSLNNLAAVNEEMKNFSQAESLYIRAKEIRKYFLGENHPDYAISLDNIAGVYMAQGLCEKAGPLLSESRKIIEQHINKTFLTLSEKEREFFLKWGFDNVASKPNSLLMTCKPITEIQNSNFNQLLFIKSFMLLNAKQMIETSRISQDDKVKKLFTEWLDSKKRLAKQYSLPIQERLKYLDSIEKYTETMEKELIRTSAEFSNQQLEMNITEVKVREKLEKNEAAIEFVRFHFYNVMLTDSIMYAAYILSKNDSIPVFVPLFEEKQLQKLFDSAGNTATNMVSKFYRGAELKSKSSAAALGKELYKLVWEPLEPYLNGIKKISYSPAGMLYNIAFHALPVDSTTILIDKYQLQQFTSTRQVALRKENKEITKPQSITLFGDASFTMDSTALVKQKTGVVIASTNFIVPPNRGGRGGTWTNLPGTAQEVKKISNLFNQNKVSTKTLTQTAASEENLKALSGHSPQILHIATHGFFLPEPDKQGKGAGLNNENTYSLADNPLLRSGLILSGGNYAWSGKSPVEGVEDGIATAYEISQLNLSSTELVVLSACETALGDVKGSEGVFGLQRAFKMAGVKKLIVSLWQVPDKETAELMTAFYGYWLSGKKIEDAFSQAQTDMRKKYAPYYWAAFVLIE